MSGFLQLLKRDSNKNQLICQIYHSQFEKKHDFIQLILPTYQKCKFRNQLIEPSNFSCAATFHTWGVFSALP